MCGDGIMRLGALEDTDSYALRRWNTDSSAQTLEHGQPFSDARTLVSCAQTLELLTAVLRR